MSAIMNPKERTNELEISKQQILILVKGHLLRFDMLARVKRGMYVHVRT